MNMTLNYHTHAKGEKYGWWGDAIHPVHYDDEMKPIRGSSWRRSVTGCKTLSEADTKLRAKVGGLPI